MKIFVNFEEAHQVVKNIGITNISDWRLWIKNNKDKNIPYNPDKIYKNEGWISYNHFWGKKHKRKNFLSYEESKNIVKSANLKSHKEFIKWHKINFDIGVPSDPNRVYKNKGWISWGSFFENQRNKKFLDYNKCKSLLKNLELNSYNDFKEWFIKNNPNNVPSNPHIYFINKGWVSWGDFLSNDKISNIQKSNIFLNYEDCKSYIKKYNFKTSKEFLLCKEKPTFIPLAHKKYIKIKDGNHGQTF